MELIAQTQRRSALAGDWREAELVHEAGERGVKLDLASPSADGFGREPSEREPRVGAIRQPDRRRRVPVEGEATVDALELVGLGLAVGERGLDQDSGHEAEGAGRARFLGLDRKRFLSELLGLGAAAFGLGVPNGPVQDLPEAMRTVVRTRQGESLRRLSSCPSVS